jgi:hypothetical protein
VPHYPLKTSSLWQPVSAQPSLLTTRRATRNVRDAWDNFKTQLLLQDSVEGTTLWLQLRSVVTHPRDLVLVGEIVQVMEFGGPEVLEVGESDEPVAGPGQVLIAAKRCGSRGPCATDRGDPLPTSDCPS